MKWLTNLLPLVSHGGAAALAWLLHDASSNGTVSPAGAGGIAVLSVGTFFAFWKTFSAKWQAAGGKHDGHVTKAEAKAALEAIGETLRLPDAAIKAADVLAGSAAALANGLMAWMAKTFNDNSPPNESKPDKVAVLMNAQQALSWELMSDAEGSAAAAKLLERLQAVWNPITPTAAPVASS